MFTLIELFVKLLLLPFKLVWEVIELSAHSNHHRPRYHQPRVRYAQARTGPYRTESPGLGADVWAGIVVAGVALLFLVGVCAWGLFAAGSR